MQFISPQKMMVFLATAQRGIIAINLPASLKFMLHFYFVLNFTGKFEILFYTFIMY